MALWKRMPEVMIGKCAEALALRTAFPRELGGTVTPEEMEHDHENVIPYSGDAEVEERKPHEALPPKTGRISASDASLLKAEISSTAKHLKLPVRDSAERVLQYARNTHGVESMTQLNREQYNDVFDSVGLILGGGEAPGE